MPSTTVFPKLRGQDPKVERTPIYTTTKQTSASKKVIATSWGSAPQYRYKLRLNYVRDNVAAPSPWAAYSELAIIKKFFADARGSFDTFYFLDPDTGTSTRVRFEADELPLTRVVKGQGVGAQVWSGDITLISDL